MIGLIIAHVVMISLAALFLSMVVYLFIIDKDFRQFVVAVVMMFVLVIGVGWSINTLQNYYSKEVKAEKE
jgi:uncharacterized membrane protein